MEGRFCEGTLNRNSYWIVVLYRAGADCLSTLRTRLYGDAGTAKGFFGRQRLYLRPELAVEARQECVFERCRGGNLAGRPRYQIQCDAERVGRLRRHSVIAYRTWKRADWEDSG